MTSLAGYGSAASLSSMEGASGSSPFLHAAYRKVAAARQEEMGFTHFSSKNRSTRDEETPLLSTPDTSSSQGSLRPDDDRETTAEPLSWTLLVTVLVVTLGSSFQFGYGTGVMNNSRSFIMGYFESHDKEYTLLEWGTVVSAYGVGGLIGSVLGPKVIGHFTGRRGTLLVNNVFLFLSSYWISFAPYWWWQVMGRIAIGIVAGVSTAVVPTYLAEISVSGQLGQCALCHTPSCSKHNLTHLVFILTAPTYSRWHCHHASVGHYRRNPYITVLVDAESTLVGIGRSLAVALFCPSCLWTGANYRLALLPRIAQLLVHARRFGRCASRHCQVSVGTRGRGVYWLH